MSQTRKLISIFSASAVVALAAVPALAAPRVFLPDGKATRPAEGWIPVSVATGDPAGLTGRLEFIIAGDDGSRMSFYFGGADSHVVDAPASPTVNLHIDGWLLRPEHYVLTATVDGAQSAPASLTLTDAVEAGAKGGGDAAKISVGKPTVLRDYTLSGPPLTVSFSVAAMGGDGGVSTSDAGIAIKVTDPMGRTRYAITRIAHMGVAMISLPLGLDDPAGSWKISAMSGAATGSTTFNLDAISNPGALVGMSNRAVYYGDDRANIFAFFRVHTNVTIVQGSSGAAHDQASRLASIMQRWNVTSNVVDAGASLADGPCVLVGSPQDNPAIAAIAKSIPATLSADYPGPDNGLIGYDGRAGGEIVYAIGSDSDGLKQAVGSIYEAATGMDPLTTFVLPGLATVDATAGMPVRKTASAPRDVRPFDVGPTF